MESDFLSSPAYKSIKSFIKEIISSIQTESQEDNKDLLDKLEGINKIIEETPLSLEKGRYANPNTKLVFNLLNEYLENRLVGNKIVENEYLKNSFGNSKRLDYGTGHELTFLCFCYTQFCRGNLKINQIYSLFKKYWMVSRKFIFKFNLEPAGSKGFWSLDDYQLLTFVFKAADRQSVVFFNKKMSVTELECMYDREVLSRSVVTKSFIYSEYLPLK